MRRRSAMEPYPGVFVTNAATEDWQSDPEVPGSVMHELVNADGLQAGLTRFTQVDGPVTWTPHLREVALILEGSVRIELADGGMLELGSGDLLSLPPGLETTWHVTTPFKEMWVLATE
jgi:uncharacterized cupin superfamily protein